MREDSREATFGQKEAGRDLTVTGRDLGFVCQFCPESPCGTGADDNDFTGAAWEAGSFEGTMPRLFPCAAVQTERRS